MTKKYQPEEEFVIEDVDTLKVLADARRLRILQLLGRKPRTVKEIADMMNTPASKLYYHVNMMEQHDLIRVVDTRIVSGIVEKHYQVSAHRYTPGPGLLSAGVRGEELESAAFAIFDKVREDLARSFRLDLVEMNTEAPPERQLEITQMHITLSQPQLERLHKRIKTLVEEVIQEKDESGDDAPLYTFFLTMFPMAERERLFQEEDDDTDA